MSASLTPLLFVRKPVCQAGPTCTCQEQRLPAWRYLSYSQEQCLPSWLFLYLSGTMPSTMALPVQYFSGTMPAIAALHLFVWNNIFYVSLPVLVWNLQMSGKHSTILALLVNGQ